MYEKILSKRLYTKDSRRSNVSEAAVLHAFDQKLRANRTLCLASAPDHRFHLDTVFFIWTLGALKGSTYKKRYFWDPNIG